MKFFKRKQKTKVSKEFAEKISKIVEKVPDWNKTTEHEFKPDVVVEPVIDENGKRIFKTKIITPHRRHPLPFVQREGQPLVGSYPDNENMRKLLRVFED